MLTEFKDAPEKAKRIFAQLVDVFEEQNINPNPLNYYVWYQYFKGDNPQFRTEMNDILDDPFGYNDRIGKRLYEQFFLDEESADDQQFDSAFKRLIALMIQKMNIWSDSLEDHTKKLDEAATSLSGSDLGADELKRLTDTVRSSATEMHQSSGQMQRDMVESTKEIQVLRQQLIEAKAEVMMDELTQIGNRKAFNHAISDFTSEASNSPGTLCLIMTDIDHFKRFNDTFGHLVGDSVLRYFSNTIKKSKLENETVCRYGGEEFAVLLNNSSIEEATERAEQIRAAISSANLKRKNSEDTLGTITSSFGVSAFKGAVETSDDFIKRADDALYYAKEHGRNQVVTEDQLAKQS